jgi:hypothetical protein
MSVPAKQSKFNEIKTILRSLLISEGSRDVTVQKLNTMYKNVEDEDIPFTEFNFVNIYDFLRSMSDTVRLEFNRNNLLCVYHIDTKKSKHISSLVARQKKGSKTKKNSRQCNNLFINKSYIKKIVPNYNQILNQVLRDLKQSCSNMKVDCGVHKSEVLSKMKACLDNEFSNLYTISSLNYDLNMFSHKLIIEHDRIYFKHISDKIKVNKNIVYNDNNNDNNNNNNNNNNTNNLSTQISQNNTFPIVDDKSNLPLLEIRSIDDIISERLKIRLQKLIEKHPEGIWCSEIPNAYKCEYNLDLDYNELGFNSITEFVAALPEIFLIVEPLDIKKQMVINAKGNSINKCESNQQAKTLASVYNFDDYIASNLEPVPNKLVQSHFYNSFSNIYKFLYCLIIF